MIKNKAVKPRNIKEQLLYQTSLLEAQKEATPDGILIVDQDGKIITYNKRFINMWKIPDDVIETKDDKAALEFVVAQLVNPDEFIKKVRFLYEHPQVSRDEILLKDGKIFDRYSAPVKSNKDVYYGYAWYFRDITEQRNLERQKDEFLAIASHELKTPITSIKVYCQVMLASFEQKGDTDAVDKLSKMYGQISKLTNLIGDLLDVTKIKAGKLVFAKENFNLNDLVSQSVEDIQLTTQRHKIIKKLTSEEDVHGDRERVGQVLTNLLSNAIKYSPNSEDIFVTTEKKKDKMVVCVQDFGMGIAKDEQKKVFKRFFRVSLQNKHTFPGLGLGLYISSEIIKRQGGKIWVESTKGKGSSFYFSIPLA